MGHYTGSCSRCDVLDLLSGVCWLSLAAFGLPSESVLQLCAGWQLQCADPVLMGITPMQQSTLASRPLCVVLAGCHVYAQTAITAERYRLEGGWLMAMPSLCWLCCTCSTTPVLAADVSRQASLAYKLCKSGLGCCTKPVQLAIRWPQAGTNGPKQRGACTHCTAGSAWCPAQLGPAPAADRCAAALLWAG